MSSAPTNTSAAATESLVGSVAAVAVSPNSTPEQRGAALQYLATLVNTQGSVPPAHSTSTAPPVYSAAPPVTPAALPPGPTAAPILAEPGPWVVGVLYSEVPSTPLPADGVVDNGQGWYGVIKGRKVGITQNHALALEAVVGVSNNAMRSYKTLDAAVTTFNHALVIGLVELRNY
ncbi:hypothetical protein B0H11DRAFT_2214628 [Mycena galericulata]|nr:hypothetical protein B0H11DRAFT_2214628 [Mycena galericulata]